MSHEYEIYDAKKLGLYMYLPSGTAIGVAFIFEVRNILNHPFVDLAQC